MAKMTKSEMKRALRAIEQKAAKMFLTESGIITIKDYEEIAKVVNRGLKRLK